MAEHHSFIGQESSAPDISQQLKRIARPSAEDLPTAQNKKPRSMVEQPLQRSNAIILKEIAAKTSARDKLCAAYASTLGPFLKKEPNATGSCSIDDTHAIDQPPQVVPEGALRGYQLDSLSFFARSFDHGVGAILGDEMGLGKTLQTIAFFAHLRFGRCLSGPFLIVCPLTVLETWENEISKWCPQLRTLKVYSNDANERELMKRALWEFEFDVVITTSTSLKVKSFAGVFSRFVWRALVVDEGHCLKNINSEQAKLVRKIRTDFRVILTGTPIQNNLIELHALLDFVCPGLFKLQPFLAAYDAKTRQTDTNAIAQIKSLLTLFMLRRLKTEVEKSVPPKHEVRVNCPLSPMQLFWYRRLLVKDLDFLSSLERSEGHRNTGDYARLNSLVIQLRKICNHPYLLCDADVIGSDALLASVAASGKLALLDRILVALHSAGHSAVIFSQWIRVLDIIEQYMRARAWRFLRLDGNTRHTQRAANIQRFQNGEASFFLMSTRAGGLGINLQRADTVILFDSDYNPQADRQAMARVHRLGQTRPVWVYRFVSAGTVEERILQRAETKLLLDTAMLDDDVKPEDLERGIWALYNLVRTSVVGAAMRPLTDDELKILMDRSQPPLHVADEIVTTAVELHDTFTVLGKRVPREGANRSFEIGSAWQELGLQLQGPHTNTPPSAGTVDPLGMGNHVAVPKLAFCACCKAEANLTPCTHKKCNSSFCSNCLGKPATSVREQAMKLINSGKYDAAQKVLDQEVKGGLQCPQHHCAVCTRVPGKAGCLFVCVGCAKAWCEACLPGGLAASSFLLWTEKLESFGYFGLSTRLPMICRSCKGHSPHLPGIDLQMAPEPTQALDLAGFQTVGDVEKIFAFLG